MSTAANTLIEEDGFGVIKRPDQSSSSNKRCYEIVRRYTMTNKSKSSVRLITWGAGIQSIKIPNNKGILGDVVLGHDSMDGYLDDESLDTVISKMTNHVTSNIQKTQNAETGSHDTFQNLNWDSCVVDKKVVMTNVSNSSVQGWLGATLTQVKFTWTDDNELVINIRAASTKPLPTNITTKCVFNLAGHGTGSKELCNHVVTINASKWTFMDIRDKVPTGDIRPVDSTIYDLRFPTLLDNKRLRMVPGGGYDHNLCIDSPSCWCYRFHARILHPGSGRFMEVYSNQPGLQFNTGNEIGEAGRSFTPDSEDYWECCAGDESKKSKISTKLIRGKDGVIYRKHGGFILSPQNYPNALNTEEFPSSILNPGQIYAHDMTYKFGVLKRFD